jgi:aspartyl-tRNA(Asn)/glutamyl-tRNA(Gln) amidotransferase subunit C
VRKHTVFAAVPIFVHRTPVSVIFVYMEITDKAFDQLAHLSRLQFTDAEKEEIKGDLQRMIAFVEKLEEVDTTGVTPLLHMSSASNVWREDEVKGSVTREEALLNAAEADGQFFKVPKVIKK